MNKNINYFLCLLVLLLYSTAYAYVGVGSSPTFSSTQTVLSASSFDYSDYGTVLLELDASDTDSITVDGSNNVTQWNDKSGNDFHAVPYSGVATPKSGTRTFAGLNVLDFTPNATASLSQRLDVFYPALNGLINSENTIVVVFGSDSLSQSGYAIGGEESGGGDRFFIGIQSSAMRMWNGYNTTAWLDGFVNDFHPHIAILNTDTSESNGYVDDEIVINSPRPANFTNDLVNLTLGAINNSGNNDLDGFICEIVIFNSVLDSAAMSAINAHLSTKWGIPLRTDDFTVFLLAGQSNMVGFHGTPPTTGEPNTRIFQVDRDATGSLDKHIVLAEQPLQNVFSASAGIGLGYQFALDYIADNPDEKVLLVPTAEGSTGLINTLDWNQGDPNYVDASDRVSAAMSFGSGTKTLSALLWLQGENDSASSEAAYGAALDQMITDMRSDFAGASTTTPFILAQLVPDFSAAGVKAALEDTPNRVSDSAFVDNTDLDDKGDNIHYNEASLTILGSRYYSAFLGLVTPSAPSNTVIPAISGTEQVGETLTCSSGTWDGNPAPTFAYQWENENVDISGATSSTYTLQASDEGDTLTCEVTATNDSGSATAESNVTGAIAAAPSFAPDDISNLTIWYKFDDSGTITGTPTVTAIADKSVNGNDPTINGDPQTGTNTINSKNAIAFDSDDSLDTGVFPDSGNVTVFICFKSPSSFSSEHAVWGAHDAANHRQYLMFNTSGNVVTGTGNSFTTGTSTYSVDTNYVMAYHKSGANTFKLYVDGTEEIDDPHTFSGTSTDSIHVASRTIGGSVISNLDSDILEFIYYSASLSTSEINQVGNYLSGECGTTWSDL